MTNRQRRITMVLVRYGATKKTIDTILKAIDVGIQYLKNWILIAVNGIVMFIVDLGRKLVTKVA